MDFGNYPAVGALVRSKASAELIEPGDLVIDIGANIGIFTGIAAQRTGPTGKVISFEPEPENAGYLQQMLTLNQLQNVRLESLGIADRKSTFRLYLSKENKGDHRLEPSEEARESIEISTVALDQYLHGELPRVIKMDIQGAEGLAIQGMTETLRQMPEGAVMMEFWPYALRRAGCDPGTILEKFTASGFRGFEIDTIKDTVQAAEPTHLLAMETEDESANLLFLKGETFRDRILQKL